MYMVRMRRTLLSCALIATLALLAAGCGDEDTPTGNGGGTSDMADLQNSVTDLLTFGTDALASDDAQLAGSPQIGDLLTAVGFPGLDIPIAAVAQTPIVRWLQRDVVRKARTPLRPRVANLDSHYGTYNRDVNDSTEPFQGWVLVDGQNPSDGFIFEFDLNDDVSVTDDMGNVIPMQGAVRFLDIVVDKGEIPIPDDDILTNVVFEIAASPLSGVTAPNLVRANLNIVLDTSREPITITLGSAAANNRQHPDAAFIGNLLIALSLDVTTPTSKPLNNVTAFAQLFDTVENFALRFDLSMTNIDFSTDLPPQSMTLGFGFGNTTTPANPPWMLDVLLDNFTEIAGLPGEYNFDVEGGITVNDASVATFAGNSREIPVDTDGDGQFDTECPDIDITFDDDPNSSMNICQALPLFDGIVPALF